MVDLWHIYHPQSPIVIRFVGLLLKTAHVLRIIWRFRCPLQQIINAVGRRAPGVQAALVGEGGSLGQRRNGSGEPQRQGCSQFCVYFHKMIKICFLHLRSYWALRG